MYSAERSTLPPEPRNVVEKFQSVNVKEGDSLTLFCKAAGEGVTMQWFKDDLAQTPGKTHYKIEINETESTLQIVNAQMDDTGWSVVMLVPVHIGQSN